MNEKQIVVIVAALLAALALGFLVVTVDTGLLHVNITDVIVQGWR